MRLHYLTNCMVTPTLTLNKRLAHVIFGALTLALASQLSIPLAPVPLTFQSATVILLGMVYGPRYGAAIVGTYLTAGILGLPVFADFSFGMHTFMGPTGGYLLGFLPAAYLSGWLAEKGCARNVILSFMAAIASASFIFLLGILQLSQFIGMQQAIALGLMPFIITETIKLFCVALVSPYAWQAKQ
jgi:biotin transport system substrate-specific component